MLQRIGGPVGGVEGLFGVKKEAGSYKPGTNYRVNRKFEVSE